jgi:ribonuclease HI
LKQVTVYTDGGCVPNPGVGGWGAVLISGKHRRELSGGDPETTNNRMELMAVIASLEALKQPCAVSVYTDSEYVKRGYTEWLPNWRRNNWKRKAGPVKNQDLWQRLDEQVQRHQVDWHWVRGHSGDPENERCHELASAAMDELRGI